MLEGLLSIFTGGATGGIIGAGAAYLNKREETKLAKLQNEHEKEMAAIDQLAEAADKAHALQLADKKIEQAESEGEIASDLKAADAFGDHIRVQLQPSGVGWIDGLRAIVRPILTAYLATVATWFAWNIHVLVGGLETLPKDEIVGLYVQIIQQIFFLTNMCVSWWFGSRGVKPKNG